MDGYLTIPIERAADPWVLGALLLGAVLAGLMCAAGFRQRSRRAVHEAVDATLREADARRLTEVATLEQRLMDRSESLTRADGRIQQLEFQLGELRAESRHLAESLAARRESEAELRTRLEETRSRSAEKQALFEQSSDMLQREFELLANRIFERQGEQHQARLVTVLAPLKDQLDGFRERVETVYTAETRDRATLLNEVRNLQQASERINREAEQLARALKGDVKTQGAWGELVLERVLESSGLREGEEYFLQESRRDGDGSLKRPDVLIRLPGDKDVVVDAKVSLVAYEQALSAEDEATRLRAEKAHTASLRSHVKRLAEQQYDRLEAVRSLDFVLLFVPVEAAFTMAVSQDERLFTEAFEQRIVIVSPTTLMMTLRVIHNVWRYEKQNRNAEEIARRAGALYDKLRGLAEDMEILGRQLQTVENTYGEAFAKLASGKGNLIRRVEELRELGAPVRKAVPRHLLDAHGAGPAEGATEAEPPSPEARPTRSGG